jgi:2'-5' RNA ligase
LKRAARGSTPFSFTVRDIGCFPDTRRPSVIWIGLHEPSGALLHLQKAVEAQLTPLGYPPEERAFKPHLTLGRIDRGASLTDLRQIGEVIRTASVGELGTVRVTGISLMKSDLQPGGSVYTRLSWATLGATHEPAGG